MGGNRSRKGRRASILRIAATPAADLLRCSRCTYRPARSERESCSVARYLSGAGKTNANCWAVDLFFCLSEGWERDWTEQNLPDDFHDVLSLMGQALHDTVQMPKIAENFDCPCEQQLHRVRGLNASTRWVSDMAILRQLSCLSLRLPRPCKLLNMVLSNCATNGVSLSPQYRKPFDLIFERVKAEEWRARRDSNPQPTAPEAGALSN